MFTHCVNNLGSINLDQIWIESKEKESQPNQTRETKSNRKNLMFYEDWWPDWPDISSWPAGYFKRKGLNSPKTNRPVALFEKLRGKVFLVGQQRMSNNDRQQQQKKKKKWRVQQLACFLWIIIRRFFPKMNVGSCR